MWIKNNLKKIYINGDISEWSAKNRSKNRHILGEKKLTVFQNLTKLPPARPPARRTCNRERKVKCVRPYLSFESFPFRKNNHWWMDRGAAACLMVKEWNFGNDNKDPKSSTKTLLFKQMSQKSSKNNKKCFFDSFWSNW